MTNEPFFLRHAREDDSESLWAWRNDPTTRAVSLNVDPVSREGHERWFSTALLDASRVIYIAVAQNGVSQFGMCRFDINDGGGSAVVSINVATDQRGRGIGGAILQSALAVFGKESPFVENVEAQVRKLNLPSIRLFTGAGFVLQATTDELDILTYRMPS